MDALERPAFGLPSPAAQQHADDRGSERRRKAHRDGTAPESATTQVMTGYDSYYAHSYGSASEFCRRSVCRRVKVVITQAMSELIFETHC